MPDKIKPSPQKHNFVDEKCITTSFDEFDENSPDIILRTLINFELVYSNSSDLASILNIGKGSQSISAFGDVIEPVSAEYKHRVAEYCCTVHQQNNSNINENQLADFVAKTDTAFNREDLKVSFVFC